MKNLFLICVFILVLFNYFINGLLNENLKGDKGIIVKNMEKDNKQFFGLFAIPYIICFFAAKGFWPPYPFFMHRKVDEMGRYVFSMDDNGIRNFCAGIMPIKFCFRPFGFKGFKFFCSNNTVTTTQNTPVETIPPTDPPTEPPTEPQTEPPTDPPTTTTTTTTTICACAQPQQLQVENLSTPYKLSHILLHTTPQTPAVRNRKTTNNPRKKLSPTKPYKHLKQGDTTIGDGDSGVRVISTAIDNRTHVSPPVVLRIHNKIFDDLTQILTTTKPVLSHKNVNYTKISSKLNLFNFRLGPFRPIVNPFNGRYPTRLPTTRRTTTTRRTSPIATAGPAMTKQTTMRTTVPTSTTAEVTQAITEVDIETSTENVSTITEAVATTTEVLGRLIQNSKLKKGSTKKDNGKSKKKVVVSKI